MKRISIRALVALFLFPCSSLCFAGGGGGITFGSQWFDPMYSNNNIGISSAGGFGYGSSGGQRIGGFGMVVYSGGPYFNATGLIGGIGGVINGWELRLRPFTLAMNVWTGVGGLRYGFIEPTGFMVGFGELNLELGVSVTRWMQVMGFAGIQVLGNLVPGIPFSALLLYTPVVGFRIAWGAM
jgi:hypothetical protein